MAGAGLTGGRPPPPSFHARESLGGGGGNPGNQLYVGNVRVTFLFMFIAAGKMLTFDDS
jgi:hypothetical protein